MSTNDYFELLNAETYEDYLKKVNVEVHQNIEQCQNLAKEYRELRIQSEKEKHEAEMKLHESAKEFYNRRKEIVCGTATLTEQELQGYTVSTDCPPNESSEYQSGIPCFWLHVLKNSGIFDDLDGNDEDCNVLTFLEDISVEYYPTQECTLQDKTPSLKYTYDVIFSFKHNNGYLRNDEIKLKLSYKLGDVDGENEEPQLELVTPIEWVPDKNPRFKKESSKRKGKNAPKRAENSFFDIFYTPEVVNSRNMNDDGSVDQECITLDEYVNILLSLINDVVPAAINYFDESLLGDDDDEDEEEDDDAYGGQQMDQHTEGKQVNEDTQQDKKNKEECTNQ